MPRSEAKGTKGPEQHRRQKPKQQDSSLAKVEKASGSPVLGGEHRAMDGLLGHDFSQSTFERHAALLGDVRMSQLSNTLHRAMIVRQLQRDYGNRYVQRLVDHISRKRAEAVQAKLTVGPAGDKYEQEADSVAKEVMGKLAAPNAAAPQRQGEEEEELQMQPDAAQRLQLKSVIRVGSYLGSLLGEGFFLS